MAVKVRNTWSIVVVVVIVIVTMIVFSILYKRIFARIGPLGHALEAFA